MGRNPNMMGRNPNMMGRNPNMMGRNQNMMRDNPNMMGNNPNMMGNNPNMMSHNQNMMGRNPNMMGHNPNMMSHNQNMMGHNPNMMSHNQNMMGHNPNMMSHNPNMMSHNQNMMSHNQNMMGNNQNMMNEPKSKMNNNSNMLNNKNNSSFVFIIPSYNGARWIKKVFDSIKTQTYKNYRIIYINDCSSDNTIAELQMYKQANPNMNIKIINNNQRGWPAYSRYVACRQTQDHEICVFLDGDDWLVDNDCLKVLAQVYENPNIHATFGSMENAPWQFKKWKKYNRANINDGEGAYFPHLRTTRAAVVKSIPPYYLQTETNEWLHVCTDVALFMAVIEAVGPDGYVFLKNAFVHYNTSNHNKNSKEGYTNSKSSDMRLYYRSTIRDKPVMKRLTYNP
jgi:hypothetical protein